MMSSMRSDAEIRRDILQAIKPAPWWLAEVLPRVRFDLIASATSAPKYRGGVIRGYRGDVYPNDATAIAPERLPQLVHELWHAFYDLVLKKDPSRFDKGIEDAFARTKAQVDQHGFGRYGDDFTPDMHVEVNFLRRGWDYYRGNDVTEMSDELWGNYIEEVIAAATTIGNISRHAVEAQTFWDSWLARHANDHKLASEYTKSAGRRYDLGQGVGNFIRNEVLRLGPRVSSWFSAYRRWEQSERQLGATCVAALKRARAHCDGSTQRVLKDFIEEWVKSEPALRKRHEELGRPAIVVRSTSNAAELGLRVQGGRSQLVFPALWARPGQFAAIHFTQLDVGVIGKGVFAAMGF